MICPLFYVTEMSKNEGVSQLSSFDTPHKLCIMNYALRITYSYHRLPG